MPPLCQVMQYHVAMEATYCTCSGFVHAYAFTLLHTLFIFFFGISMQLHLVLVIMLAASKGSYHIGETKPIWLVLQARTARYR